MGAINCENVWNAKKKNCQSKKFAIIKHQAFQRRIEGKEEKKNINNKEFNQKRYETISRLKSKN